MISRNDHCWCGSGKKWKKCHYPEVSFDELKKIYFDKYQIILKTEEEIKKIKHSCKIAAKILNILCDHAKEGITTNELDILSRRLHKEENAIPAPLGYGSPPFPKSICTSLNEVICHGIPNDEPLKYGDILNIDVTTIVEGYYGDCSKMVKIGKVSEEKNRVIDVSYECLMRAINICKPGTKIYEIGNVIESYAKKYNCSVVDQFVGHGIGIYFHEPPRIPHHYNNLDISMEKGMIFTIEPMINIGVKEAIISKEDGWTATTKDLKPSAQWEHTLLITEKGHEILTELTREVTGKV